MAENRTRIIGVRVSPAEGKAINAAAKRSGMTPSEFVRTAACQAAMMQVEVADAKPIVLVRHAAEGVDTRDWPVNQGGRSATVDDPSNAFETRPAVVADPDNTPILGKPRTGKKPAICRGGASGMCEHRVPTGSFCKASGRVVA